MVKKTAILFTFIGIFLLLSVFVVDWLDIDYLRGYLWYWASPFLFINSELCGGLHTAGSLTTSLCDYFIPILLLLGYIFCHTVLGVIIGYIVIIIKQKNNRKT